MVDTERRAESADERRGCHQRLRAAATPRRDDGGVRAEEARHRRGLDADRGRHRQDRLHHLYPCK